MKYLLLAASFAVCSAGCTNLNEGKTTLTDEVTAQPSAAFMKKVASDPFPAAGSPVKNANSATKTSNAPTRIGAATPGAGGAAQAGMPRFPTMSSAPTASPTGTAKKTTGTP